MRVTKKLNNNVALARDADGNDAVIFGKGVGFPRMPYDLDGLSAVDRVFYNISRVSVEQASTIPEDVMAACVEAVDDLASHLTGPLNPNLPFTLADHVAFAVKRLEQGIEFSSDLAYDIENLYPAEFKGSQRVLALIKSRIDTRLPESEATSITMHLVNAQLARNDMQDALLMTQAISDVTEIVEKGLGIMLNAGTFTHFRFVTHLRYLIERLLKGSVLESNNSLFFQQFRDAYPEPFKCASDISGYFSTTFGWQCSDEEILYLMLHINRVLADSGEEPAGESREKIAADD